MPDVPAILSRQRFLPILRTERREDAVAVGRRLVQLGVACLEVSLTTPGALEALSELSQAAAVVGAGTVITEDDARQALGAGARFIVSPADPTAVRRVCEQAGVFYLPGVLTPTEIIHAVGQGSRVLKLFPARGLGVHYLKDLRGPFPAVHFVPTGGIDPADAVHWLNHGALAVGLGRSLVQPLDAIAAKLERLHSSLQALP